MTKAAQRTLIIRWILLVLWTCLIFLFSTLYLSVSEGKAVAWVSSQSVSWGLPRDTPGTLFHLLAYAVWAWLCANVLAEGSLRITTERQIIIVLPVLVALASLQELLQVLNESYHASVFDALVSIAGGGAGLALHLLLCQRGRFSIR